MATAHPNPLPASPGSSTTSGLSSSPTVSAAPRPNEPADLADDLRMYRLVRRIRSFEESLVTLFGEGKVYGTAHTCVGQEGVAVGALFDLTDDDFVTGTHRSHGHCIAKGADVGAMMAELPRARGTATAAARAGRCTSPTSTSTCSGATGS